VVTYEHRVVLADGSLRWQQWTDRAIFNTEGQLVEFASVGRDITDRKLAQDALRMSEESLRRLNLRLEERVRQRTSALKESEERFMLAVRGANDGLWDWNLKTNEIYFSPRWKTMMNFSEGDFENKPAAWFRHIHPEDLPQFQTELAAHLNGNTDHFESEYRMSDADQQYHWMLCRGLAVRDENGKAYRMAGSQTDITGRKTVEERLAHDALHDALTGLPNRTLFVDRLSQRLERAKRHKDDLFAILFLDMDRFKIINDSLGHAVGDKFLITTSYRLQACLRPEDTISRLGGDEFAILLDEISDVSDAVRVAERIQAQMQGTALLGTVQRSSSVSVGITIFNGNYADPQEMLRDADSAMYRAKSQGGGRYQIFDQDMYKSALALLQMETDLKRAVEKHEWLVYYQPVVLSKNRRIVGLEALIRWLHPERGLVAPGEFIPVAEESGLIVQIGEYVLREACRQVKLWRDAGHENLWVSVNLSARQFQDQVLVRKVQEVLEEVGLPGDSLRLEVTETVAMKDFEYSVKVLKELNELGIHLSLDDFGNGYSSLGYLRRFPIRSLKIDRSFIRDIDVNKNSEAITSAIISLGHNLNLEVVAEGVETEQQFAFLKDQVCDEIQGFLFSRPVPVHEIGELIQRWDSITPAMSKAS
jgi:diguanylate cyclase (GGDEF)-like protein/PAS domain S-box-containing protein